MKNLLELIYVKESNRTVYIYSDENGYTCTYRILHITTG